MFIWHWTIDEAILNWNNDVILWIENETRELNLHLTSIKMAGVTVIIESNTNTGKKTHAKLLHVSKGGHIEKWYNSIPDGKVSVVRHYGAQRLAILYT